jgi:hypothetical protein
MRSHWAGDAWRAKRAYLTGRIARGRAKRLTWSIASGLATMVVPSVMVALVAGQARAQALAGYVWEARGPWYASSAPSTPLTKGMGLRPGDRIVLGGSLPAGSAITVILRDGRRMMRTCRPDSMRECRQPITLPVAEPSKRVVARIVDAVLERFEHEPERYASLMSRGTEGATDAVVLLRGDSLDLAPALSPVDSGDYELCVSPLKRDGAQAGSEARDCPVTVRYAWRPEQPAAMLVHGLAPGLYSVRLSDADPRQAWVLVSDATHFAQHQASFARATSITEGWQGTRRSANARSFLRAYLDYLSANPVAR